MTKTIEAVISMDTFKTNTNTLAVKIEEAKKKRTGLIELYTSGNIDKNEFTTLRANYNKEIENLKAMADGIEKQQIIIQKYQEQMANIKITIDELMSGIQYEDEYYTQLLDKMVVNDKNHIDVYLNMLPYKWQFGMAQIVKRS